ncbi:hypothetical protein KA005_30200 [bacterium]|nr:hypothetical protein [bacterium]
MRKFTVSFFALAFLLMLGFKTSSIAQADGWQPSDLDDLYKFESLNGDYNPDKEIVGVDYVDSGIWFYWTSDKRVIADIKAEAEGRYIDMRGRVLLFTEKQRVDFQDTGKFNVLVREPRDKRAQYPYRRHFLIQCQMTIVDGNNAIEFEAGDLFHLYSNELTDASDVLIYRED